MPPFRIRKIETTLGDQNIAFYDMNHSSLARFFLLQVEEEKDNPGGHHEWLTVALAEGYATGKLKVPRLYRRRIREAVLKIRLDEAMP